jgi:ABC transporter with metal-binding/Fe-S-binding domain ATP-binding protein
MRVGVLFSGGKDSALALHKAKQKGHEVVCLLNINVVNKDSFMFHKPHLELLKKQAKLLGIPLLMQRSKGEKEKELIDLEKLIVKAKEKYRFKGIVIGGIASSYQGKRIKKICQGQGLKFIPPLWNYTAEKLWKELLDFGFKIILTKISCEGLGKEWLGKIIFERDFKELKKLSEKNNFRLDFEGGEAETAVLWMPEFKSQSEIKLKTEVKSEGRYRHWLEIKKVR